MSLKELLSKMDLQTPAATDLVSRAYVFAEEAHKDHKRFSGEPYFNHLYETAVILAELGLGPATVAAGLLHDSIEDVGVKPEAIEKEFGKEILFLVEGVTKLGKLRYHGVKRHIESLRKLFVATSKDLRVLIIKLADRLHNMRTLEHVRAEKQKRIASETLEIYAPLAYRLGIRKLSRELEDLAFAYVYPDDCVTVKGLLKKKYREMESQLEKFHRSVRKGLVRQSITNIHTSYRIKGLYSLYRKLQRKEWDFEKIYDFLALRIVVPTVEDCYRVLGAIHGIWRPLPGRIKDYIAFPKPNGYRSIHTTVFTGSGGIIEIQIRTEEMHDEAEFGIASHFSYKESLGKKKAKKADAWIKQFMSSFSTIELRTSLAGAKSDMPAWVKELGQIQTGGEAEEYLLSLKTDFFENRVFVFTPKGDVVDLPVESSTIDFGYAIHSDIGSHASGAKVNGKLVSLDTKIKNGDIVEIITKESARPSRKWLDFVKTSFAKKRIKTFLENQRKEAR